MKILAIETTCDDTGIAIIDNGNVIFDIKLSSQEFFTNYGGIVPELAARTHGINIIKLLKQVCNLDGFDFSQISYVAYASESCQEQTIALPKKTGTMLALFSSTWVCIWILGYAPTVMTHISFCTPYAIVAIYPKISKMNINLINASMDLGHSRIATYFKFVISYLKSAIITAAIIVTTISFDDFIITLLVNGNFETIGTAIFESRKGIQAWIVTFGALLVMLLILIVILVSIYRIYKNRKENYEKHKT